MSATGSTLRWWQVLNPAIYLISVLPGLCLFAWLSEPDLALWVGVSGIVFIQHAVNVSNDFIDGKTGADVEKWNSWWWWANEDVRLIQWHVLLSVGAGIGLGVIAILWSERYWLFLHAAVFVTLGLGYNYTKKPMSYGALGEWVTAICYGPGVFVGLYVLAGGGASSWGNVLLGSVSFACLSVSILLSHQPPQILTDSAVGKSSFAVRHGVKRTLLFSRGMYWVYLSALFLMHSIDLSLSWPLLGGSVLCSFVVWRRTSPASILMSASLILCLDLWLRKGTL